MKLLSEISQALPAQLPLLLGWILYALLHSLTASTGCKEFVRQRWPALFSRYRLLYNLLALLLLVPLIAMMQHNPGPQLWSWTGISAWALNGIAGLALLSFLFRGGGYNMGAFLGVHAAASRDKPRLVISDWHRFIRHPWYSLALLLIWTRDMSAATFISAEAITMYFVIGSRFEERKLVAEFGERYRSYQRKVPRLFPLPWRVLSKEDAKKLCD